MSGVVVAPVSLLNSVTSFVTKDNVHLFFTLVCSIICAILLAFVQKFDVTVSDIISQSICLTFNTTYLNSFNCTIFK